MAAGINNPENIIVIPSGDIAELIPPCQTIKNIQHHH